MSNDLPNSGNGHPPSFGSDFKPHTNPVDPAQSWIAQHQERDSSGRFVKSEHLTNGQPNTNHINSHPSSASSSNNGNSVNNGGNSLPPGISITQNNKYSEKKDPPLVNANISVTNPVAYFKKWVYQFFKNQDIDLHLRIKPFATIGLILAFSIVSGASYTIGFNAALSKLFPNSSPLFHRAISLQGVIQKSQTGGQYYLVLPDNTLWTLKPTNNNINLSDSIDKSVVVKGNLNSEPNVIEVKEVISFDTKPIPQQYMHNTASRSGQTYP